MIGMVLAVPLFMISGDTLLTIAYADKLEAGWSSDRNASVQR